MVGIQDKDPEVCHLFAGQGAQRPGMGEEVLDLFPARVSAASQILGYSVRQVCLEGPAALLGLTDYTQPLLYVIECLSFDHWREVHGDVDGPVAGHSLGEFAALYAAGAYDFATGLGVVQERGRLMRQTDAGAMAAITRVPVEKVSKVLSKSGVGGLEIANVNAPLQCVVSGPVDSIGSKDLLAAVSTAGGRLTRLRVSGAFHSTLMRPAQARFARYLDAVDLLPLRRTVLSNVTGRPMPAEDYRDLVVEQMASPVRWLDSMRWLIDHSHGPDTIVEHGPGKTLTKLLKQSLDAPMT